MEGTLRAQKALVPSLGPQKETNFAAATKSVCRTECSGRGGSVPHFLCDEEKPVSLLGSFVEAGGDLEAEARPGWTIQWGLRGLWVGRQHSLRWIWAGLRVYGS